MCLHKMFMFNEFLLWEIGDVIFAMNKKIKNKKNSGHSV